MIGASYNFGPVIAKASFTNYKVAGSFNANVYQGGLAYFVMSPPAWWSQRHDPFML